MDFVSFKLVSHGWFSECVISININRLVSYRIVIQVYLTVSTSNFLYGNKENAVSSVII